MDHSTYWMAGLAHDAAHFFKFLLIIVLYTLIMTLFVRFCYLILPRLIIYRSYRAEFPLGNAISERRDCDSPFRSFCTLPDDLCWFLCPPRFDTACLALAAMALPTQGA